MKQRLRVTLEEGPGAGRTYEYSYRGGTLLVLARYLQEELQGWLANATSADDDATRAAQLRDLVGRLFRMPGRVLTAVMLPVDGDGKLGSYDVGMDELEARAAELAYLEDEVVAEIFRRFANSPLTAQLVSALGPAVGAIVRGLGESGGTAGRTSS